MASGRINGSCTGTAASKYDLWIEWYQTPDVANGRSKVTAAEYLQRNDGWADSAYNLNADRTNKRITINGSTAYATTNGIDTRNSARISVVWHSVWVYHSDFITVDISAIIPEVTSPQLTGGSVSGKITLDAIDTAPLTITSFWVSDVTQTRARLNYTVTGGTVAVAEYSVNGGSTWATIPSGNVVTGLSPNTDYNFVLRLTKSTNGKTTTSNIVSQKTLPIYVTEISYENQRVEVGKSLKIIPTISPENASIKSVSLQSNNPNIVSVNGDVINCLAKGNATITIMATDGSGVSSTCTITVFQPVTGIVINPSDLVVEKNSSFEVPYQVIPSDADDKRVTITSSDSDIVSISGNVASAVENGQATITVETVDGGFVATLNVNVVGNYTWFNYSEPLEILNTEDIAHIESNIKTIRAMLLVSGRTIPALENVSKAKDTSLLEIIDILQNIEYNLDRINSTDVISVYYKAQFIVGEYAENRENIWRWIQILNDLYNILNGTFGKWQRLRCIDGYPTIKDNTLLVRGEMINA